MIVELTFAVNVPDAMYNVDDASSEITSEEIDMWMTEEDCGREKQDLARPSCHGTQHGTMSKLGHNEGPSTCCTRA